MPWGNPEWWIGMVPFLITGGDKQPKFSTARLIEAAIIAIVTGGVVLYGTVQVIGAQIESVQAQQRETTQQIRDVRREIHDIRRDMVRK